MIEQCTTGPRTTRPRTTRPRTTRPRTTGPRTTRPRRPRAPFFAFLVAGVLALGTTLAFAPRLVAGQDGRRDADLPKSAQAPFASFRFRSPMEKEWTRVEARSLRRINVARSPDHETLWLELFYVNGDYVLQRVEAMIFYQKDGVLPPMKVRLDLIAPEALGFPIIN